MNTHAQHREDFLRKTFRLKGFDIQWFDETGTIQLSGNRLAKLKPVYVNRGRDHMKVTILHKLTGEIDIQWFEFKRYLKTLASTVDPKAPVYLCLISDYYKGDQFSWETEPGDLSELMNPIEAYLKAWEVKSG